MDWYVVGGEFYHSLLIVCTCHWPITCCLHDFLSRHSPVAMSFNLFIVLFLTRTTRDLEAMERYHFFACFGGAFAFAFVPMFVWSGERGGAYGPATTW